MDFKAESVPLLEMNDASVVRGGRRVLDGVCIRIADREHTAILGPNGAGKSSLLRLIARECHPLVHQDGTPSVSIFGRSRWNVFELRTMLGIVSADLHQDLASDSGIPAIDAVLSGFFASHGLFRNHAVTEAMRERANAALRRLEVDHLERKPVSQMSTGELRRVLIARSLVANPRALLLDEPSAGLDPVATRRFAETLRRIARDGKTIILVTHHVEEILPEVNRVILLKDGRVFRDGDKESVLTTEILSELFGASVAVRRSGDYYAVEIAPYADALAPSAASV